MSLDEMTIRQVVQHFHDRRLGENDGLLVEEGSYATFIDLDKQGFTESALS